VLFVARCADVLHKNETAVGGVKFAAILAVGWWAWASTTLYANRFDTDDAVFRLLSLTGMAGVIAMAAAAGKIMTGSGHWFALGYVLLRVVLDSGGPVPTVPGCGALAGPRRTPNPGDHDRAEPSLTMLVVLCAVVLVTGVATGVAQHRVGQIRVAKV
jgi:hypothetical protein